MTVLLISIAGAILLIAALLSCDVKAPPHTAYIITGFRPSRTLIGGASIRIPFLERIDKLTLRVFSVAVKTAEYVPNAEYIHVKVEAAAKIQISQNPELLALAVSNFLNEKEAAIVSRVSDTLEGCLREIISEMSLDEMVAGRKAFGERAAENAKADLEKMGLELISFKVQSIADEDGMISGLGTGNIAKIKKEAAISQAASERDIAIAQAEAQREASDASVESMKAVAEKQSELALRQAELKRTTDVQTAIADAAYAIEEAGQKSSVEIAKATAAIALSEKEAELKARQAGEEARSLEAEARARADAHRYEEEQEAEAKLQARKKEAEASRFEAEQNAAAIAAMGEAEASAIRAKAVAEAEGIERKAEAMASYGQAAVVEMVIRALPDIARNVAEPLSKVDKITMYGDGNSTRLLSDVIGGTAQVAEGLAEGLGLDLKRLISEYMASRKPEAAIEEQRQEIGESLGVLQAN